MLKNKLIADFENRIDSIVEDENLPDLQERYRVIEELNEEFFELTGLNLPSALLSKLTDWVLAETLKDRTVDKVANNEFAILSFRQIKRRTKRETVVMDNVMDYLELKYKKNQSSLARVNRKETE